LVAWLLDLVLPRRCVSCGVSAELLCGSCRARLRPVSPPLCARCGASTAWPVERCRECAGRRLAFASARAAVAYAAPVPALVRAWKEHGLRRVASLAAELVVSAVEQPPADVITHIPPDPDRQLRRSVHPAEALARELGTRWQVETVRLLVRARHARRQTGLSLAERRRNVRGVFDAAREGACRRERVLLVDDVYTTGSTAHAAASALRAAGAAEVHVVTFARAVR
jgi:ComF family protein